VDFTTIESRLLKIFTAAQGKRSSRRRIIGGEVEWVTLERQLMIDTVQKMRKEENLPLVPVEDILRAEREACGHTDYTVKFVRYCAEITIDGRLLRTVW